MPTTTLPAITESQLFTTFLLTPSLLRTILPYTTFLAFIPQPYRNDPDYAPTLKRLYHDLQFQRSITVDRVRANIERECGVRAATLRARLARTIAIEEGDIKAEEKEMKEVVERRKRKRAVALGGKARGGDKDQDGDANDGEVQEEELSSDYDEFTDPRELEAQRTFHSHESFFHPAAHFLPSEHGSKRRRSETNSAFHTKGSLIAAMENASRSLEREIEGLQTDCAKLRQDMKETVEGLSDLRYGKSRPSRDKEGDYEADESGEYNEVMCALEDFGSLVRLKMKSTAAVTS